MAFVAPSGDLMAWHKSAWLPEDKANQNGLEAFGMKTGNSYTDLWKNNNVFRS